MTAGHDDPDLALLDRMARASRDLGIVTAQARTHHVRGEGLDPDALREIGGTLQALAAALAERADDIDADVQQALTELTDEVTGP